VFGEISSFNRMYRWWFNKYSLATLYCLWFRSDQNLVFIFISSGIRTCTALVYLWILFEIYEMWTSLRSTSCKYHVDYYLRSIYLILNRKIVQFSIHQRMKSIIKTIYLSSKLMEISIESIVKIYVYSRNYFSIIKHFIMMLNHFYSMF
jgi:hypothetical protein